jgi:Putative MetA-pathway of phenol degradation
MIINQKWKQSILILCFFLTGLVSQNHIKADDLTWVEQILQSDKTENRENQISLISSSSLSPAQVFLTGCDSSCGCSRGTLFQWPGSTATGGPDLSEALVTDRPDFTEASSTVGNGVAQIEFGYTYVYDNNNNESTKTNSFGEPLLRYGIYDDWLELRIGIAPTTERTKSPGNTSNESGISDLYLGFKIALTPQDGILPEMAIIPQMNVPTGSSAFTSDHVEPGLNWIYGWELNNFVSMAGSTQGNRRIDDANESYLEMAQSWTFAYTLTEKLGAYTEWYAILPSGGNMADNEHYANGGFTYLISNDIQFDIRAGVGLNEDAADYFIGSGFSIRLH